MKWLLDQQIIEIFIVYCRVGPCIMLFPGFAQPQIPARIRGLISLVIAMALWSHLGAGGRLPRLDTREAIVLCSAREFAFGITLGLTGRCVMAALEMFGAAISASMGLTMNIGIMISGDGQALSERVVERVLLLAISGNQRVRGRAVRSSHRVVVVPEVRRRRACCRDSLRH